ncbi:hypothetical protein UNDYM_2327 [Undibacterium sp. YM2]|uniref:hypothetical protein n=1 Tax=Undibacterium sp. YM2 TaxID=2058625 RepID=UPI001331FAD1|nr:hypothetical protein [Undibacterium sp. YM2]BBB66580.1 hypothetical protein UNDYM_2327 [Undibacterium sp. YM2]
MKDKPMARAYIMVVLVTTILFGTQICIASPHKQIDLRNQTDADGEYTVSICSRPSPGPEGLPGHMFVAYSFKPTDQDRKVIALGYTTRAGLIQGVLSFSALLTMPSGYLGEENFTHMEEQCLELLVNKNDFDHAWSIAQPFYNLPALSSVQYAGIYSLTNNDCETFATQVARTFNSLVVPQRKILDLPEAYVRKLIDAN